MKKSFEIEERIVKRNGEYFVVSEDGKRNLGGPYDSREQAVKRLRQVEFFKNKESLVFEVQNFIFLYPAVHLSVLIVLWNHCICLIIQEIWAFGSFIKLFLLFF